MSAEDNAGGAEPAAAGAVITLLCPNLKCRAMLEVPEAVRGKPVRCGCCGTVFRVPTRKPQKSEAEAGKKKE